MTRIAFARHTGCLTLALALPALLSPLPAAQPPPPISPEIHSDRSVTFRLAAPNAAVVKLNLEGAAASAPLQRGTDGTWAVTIGPLEPDFYAYSFLVDGVPAADANNPATKPNLMWLSNVLHVPGPRSLSWELNDVPHGELHHHFYRSSICGDDRDYVVYTPPGYDPARAEPYPTLYLLHGFSDEASSWSTVGRANVILDNLIAQGRAKPMVVVMPLGYGDLEIVRKARAGNGNMRSGGMALMARNGQLFEDTLLRELIPRLEREYHLSGRREDRAVTGNSMGGGEALRAGLNHPDIFAWVGSFSAGGLSEDIPAEFARIDPAQDATLKLLWVACGEDDALYPFNQRIRAFFTSKGIHPTELTTPQGHVWMVWRRNLTQFVPLLFR
jgi:enterochelin esterase-like enzyme